MLVIIDMNPHLPPELEEERHDSRRWATRYSEMIRYHLYREYHLDTGTYHLCNADLEVYCRILGLLRLDLFQVGHLAVAHRKYHSDVRIKNRDAYVTLFGESIHARGTSNHDPKSV